MTRDLRVLLDGWEYEPGKISVRKIIGRDGREKLQTRVDLGVLQMELTGRPDGRRPFGQESLLEHFESRLHRHRERCGSDGGFALGPSECAELRHEAHLYYQRYLSLFVIDDFAGVERDTAHHLRIADLCHQYAETREDREALEPQRAYVMMMNARARVYAALRAGNFTSALSLTDGARARIREWLARRSAEAAEQAPELEVLAALRTEVLERMPADTPQRIRFELEAALECEDYERAARLRDRLEVLRHGRPT